MSHLSLPRVSKLTVFPIAASAVTVCLVVVSFLSWGAQSISAQSTTTIRTTDGKTPMEIAPGSPAGSYPLSDFDNINLYNQSLGFRLPLLHVGGRGSAGYTITLPIERKWRIDHTVYNPNLGCEECDGYPIEHHYFPNTGWSVAHSPGFGPGVMVVRPAGGIDTIPRQSCGTVYLQTLTRLTFIMPDGTEYELHDTRFGGATKPPPTSGCSGANRGREFITADGSTATFIALADVVDRLNPMDDLEQVSFPISGDLFLRDGTRYHIEENQVVWIRDRNGNVVRFYGDRAVDSLGREVTFNGETITYKGVGGTPRSITVVHGWLSNRLRGGETLKSFGTLFPSIPINGPGDAGFMNSNFDSDVVSEVLLPDNRKYEFYYNSYGELARVVLPTGGAFEYDYQASDGVLHMSVSGEGERHEIFRRVVRRRVYRGNGQLEGVTTFGPCENASPGSGNSCVQVDQLDPNPPPESASCAQPLAGSGYRLVSRTKHFYHGIPGPGLFTQPTDYAAWYEGREFRTETYACDGTTLLRSFEQTWRQRGNPDWSGPEPARDPRVIATTTTLVESNQISKQTFGYSSDLHNNQTDVWEYDYGVGAAPAFPMRHTHTDYVVVNPANNIHYADPANGTSYAVTDVHIRSLVRGQQVYAVDPAGNETLAAQSESRYDESAYPLLTYGTITGWESPGAARGLATTSRAWLNTSNTWLETHAQYDQVGNIRATWNAKGNLSQFSYADSFSDGIARNTYALPTIATSPVPDPSGQHGSPSAFIATSVYDFWTGRITSATDVNNQTTSVQYNDLLDRPTKVTHAVGTGVANQTTFDYNDANRTVTTTSDKDTLNDNLLKSQTLYDGLGRTVETRQYEGGSNYIATQQQYDALGRAYTASSPFRPWQSESPVWTTTVFDALGRVLSVRTPDGAVVATAYRGSQLLVTDQAGKQRLSQTNALAQLKDVWEITPNDPTNYPGIEPVSFNGQSLYAYHTSYAYDSLDDLTNVIQGSQTRTFAYDSLKRLLSATNPESGRICYGTVIAGVCQGNGYDPNGNLIYRTDARGVLSTYAYDALNRNTGVTYTDDPANTPAVIRIYDGATNGKGKLWKTETTGTSASRTTISGFDVLGRPISQSQQFYSSGAWSQPYTAQRSYDLAGHVRTQWYPSGHTVNYAYDSAGRTSSFTGNLGEGVQRTYANEFEYAALGGMQQEKFGTDTPLYHKQRFNQREQLWDMRLSTVSYSVDPANGDRGSLINYYSNNFVPGGSGADNNGNLLRQDIYVPGSGFFQDNFSYDSLNRLQSISEKLNGTGSDTFKQAYSLDRWGNRTIDQANTTANVPHPEYTVDPANNNRLLAPAGFTHDYDAAGNQTRDTYTTNSPTAGYRTYDAENRIIAAQKPVSGKVSWAYYNYDGYGQRVRRKTATFEIWQVYGFDGELLAEYPRTGPSLAVAQPQKEYGYRAGQLLVTAEPYANIAWNQPATQSDTLESLSGAGKALDGDVDGELEAGHTAATNSHPNSWWQVDLQTVQTVNSLTVWGRTDCCPEMTSDFYVLVSDVPFTSTDLNATINQAGVSNYFHSGFSGPTATAGPTSINVNRTGRYVRVQLAGTGSLALAEVQAWSAAAKVEWLVADPLGTPRMSVDQSGSLAAISRHDYLPFGEDLSTGTSLRANTPGYSVSDGVRQKFTSQERDTETGLDYFGARYYASTQGRFTGVDPLMASARAPHPQSWNRYVYCYNNPLGFIDDDGMDVLALDLKAQANVLSTLPEDIREQVQKSFDENGLLARGSLDNIESSDENFAALKELVDFSETTEVGTAAGYQIPGEAAQEFSYQTAEQSRQEAITSLVKTGVPKEEAVNTFSAVKFEDSILDGVTLSPSQSPSGNLRVLIADQTGKTAGEPSGDIAAATGHELYVHAVLFRQNKPWTHESGGPSGSQFKQVEERSRANFRGQPKQATPQGVKPSN